MRKPDKQVLIQDKHKCYMKRGMKGKLIPCLKFKSRSHSMQNKGDTAYPSLAILFLVLLTSEWLKAQYFGHTSKCPKARLQRLALDLFFPCFFFLLFFPPSVVIFIEAHLFFAQTFGFEQLTYMWQKAILPEKFLPTPISIFWRVVAGLQFYQELHQQM